MSDTPPAGWYPDPGDTALQRYWDGDRWTEHTAPGLGVSTDDVSGEAVEQWPGADTTPAGGRINTWTWQSFVVTLLCGGTFVSMIGIYNAGKAEGAIAAGDTGAARRFARRARNWTLGGLAFGIAAVVVVALGFAALVSFGESFGDCAGVTPSDGFDYAYCVTVCEQDPNAAECALFER